MNRIALGRGLDALIPTLTTESDTHKGAAVVNLSVTSLEQNPQQPRKQWDQAKLQELADSIRVHGILQPILVRAPQSPSLAYHIIAGERRWAAAKLAGLSTVPVIVADHGGVSTDLEWALIENLQREDLHVLDEAAGYAKLAELFGYTQEEIAAKVGKDRTTVSNTLRLLSLPDSIRDKLASGKLTAGHARALLAIPHAHEQLRLTTRVIAEHLSVRKLEELIYGRPKRVLSRAKRKSPELEAVEHKLRQRLGATVRVAESRKRGRIIIDYFGHEDLNRLLGVMGV